MKNAIEWLVGLIGTILCYGFGKIDTPVIVLLFFVGADYITGIIKGIIKGKLSSKVGLKGFFKKILILIVVSVGVQLDRVVGTNGVLRNFVLYYYIANEGLSILENVVAIGVPIPSSILKVLEQMESENK